METRGKQVPKEGTFGRRAVKRNEEKGRLGPDDDRGAVPGSGVDRQKNGRAV